MDLYRVYLDCYLMLPWTSNGSILLINCPFAIANFGVNSLSTTFFMKAILAEVLFIF